MRAEILMRIQLSVYNLCSYHVFLPVRAQNDFHGTQNSTRLSNYRMQLLNDKQCFRNFDNRQTLIFLAALSDGSPQNSEIRFSKIKISATYQTTGTVRGSPRFSRSIINCKIPSAGHPRPTKK